MHLVVSIVLSVLVLGLTIAVAVLASKYQSLKSTQKNKNVVALKNYVFYTSMLPDVKTEIPVVILLTCTAFPNASNVKQNKTDERIRTYVDSARAWVSQNAFPVVMVDNSDYSYPELSSLLSDRFQILAFDENKDAASAYVRGHYDKGLHELNAIRYAYQTSDLLQRAKFIVKVTGRFFVETLASELTKEKLHAKHFVHQKNAMQCQIVGCSKTYFWVVFSPHIHLHSSRAAENHYNQVIAAFKKNEILTLPKLNIAPTQEGGSAKIITAL